MSFIRLMRCGAFLGAGLVVSSSAAAQTTGESTTLGGYGEVHYTNRSGPGTPGEANVKRFVLFVGHTFSERISLHGELELEDAKVEGGDPGGEVALEQAYLDYRIQETLSLRAGLVLIPVGIINETHEPPTFHGVGRPEFDHDVIPATWREIGIGASGTVPGVEGLRYRGYLVNGLMASGFSGASGIRGGRQSGREARFANPSVTGRLEWAAPGLRVGGAFWYGGTANQDPVLGRGTFDAPVFLLAADARYDTGPFALRAVLARVAVSDADRINAAYATDIGRRIEGGYLEGAVNLLRGLAPASRQQLWGFLRHERFDLHAAVPPGTPRNDALARRLTTAGLTWKPAWNVAFKADVQWNRNRAGVGEDEAVALALGYQF